MALINAAAINVLAINESNSNEITGTLSVTESGGAQLKYWNGVVWVNVPVTHWNGSEWV